MAAMAGMMAATSLLMNEPMMKATGTIMQPVADALTSKYSPLTWLSDGLGWAFGTTSKATTAPPPQARDVNPKHFIAANHWMLEQPGEDGAWTGRQGYDEEREDARQWMDRVKKSGDYRSMMQIALDPEHHQLAAEITDYPELFTGDAIGLFTEPSAANAFDQPSTFADADTDADEPPAEPAEPVEKTVEPVKHKKPKFNAHTKGGFR